MSQKHYSVTANVGRVRHLVSFHDGAKTHKDGSPFSDIRTFSNVRERDRFCRDLLRQGYRAD